MPFPIPRGPGLAQLAQTAQQAGAGRAIPPGLKRNPEPAGNIPKRIQETINPVDLPGGVGQVGPPQPISQPFPGGQQQPSPIPPQMPPGMQFPIQDPTPAPPPIGQPAPIPPLNLGPIEMPMPPTPPQAPRHVGTNIDPNDFNLPQPTPFDPELEFALSQSQKAKDEERARQRRNTPITLHGPGYSSRNPGR